MVKKNSRSDAARKAWETRRRLELQKKRSEAARKAWATRRATARKARKTR